jgi:hypothetical protein
MILGIARSVGEVWRKDLTATEIHLLTGLWSQVALQ